MKKLLLLYTSSRLVSRQHEHVLCSESEVCEIQIQPGSPRENGGHHKGSVEKYLSAIFVIIFYARPCVSLWQTDGRTDRARAVFFSVDYFFSSREFVRTDWRTDELSAHPDGQTFRAESSPLWRTDWRTDETHFQIKLWSYQSLKTSRFQTLHRLDND